MTTATPPCMYDNSKNAKGVAPVDDAMVPKHELNMKTWQTIHEILLCVTETVLLQYIISRYFENSITLRSIPLSTVSSTDSI
jgi:hypothetical protein